MTLKTGLNFLKISVLSLVVAAASSLTHASRSEQMELRAFEEICEFTGQVKTSLRYVPVPLNLDLVVESLELPE